MNLEQIIEGIHSSDMKTQQLSTQSCRRILSRERQPPIDDIIKAGVVPRLVDFLGKFDRYIQSLIFVLIYSVVSDNSLNIWLI